MLLQVLFLRTANDWLVFKLTAYLEVMINHKSNFCMQMCKQKSRNKKYISSKLVFLNLV